MAKTYDKTAAFSFSCAYMCVSLTLTPDGKTHTYTQRKKILIRTAGKNLLKEVILEYSSMILEIWCLHWNYQCYKQEEKVSHLKKQKKTKKHQKNLELKSHLLNSFTCPITFLDLTTFLWAAIPGRSCCENSWNGPKFKNCSKLSME